MLFNKFDKNDDGYISWKEFKKTIKSLKKKHGKDDLTNQEIREFFDSFDSNGDEKIYFKEFKTISDMPKMGMKAGMKLCWCDMPPLNWFCWWFC